MSPSRVLKIIHAENNMRVGIRGKPGEEVTMAFLINNYVRRSTCKVDTSGSAVLDAMIGCYPSHTTSSHPTSIQTTSDVTTDIISTTPQSSVAVVSARGIVLYSLCFLLTVLMK